ARRAAAVVVLELLRADRAADDDGDDDERQPSEDRVLAVARAPAASARSEVVTCWGHGREALARHRLRLGGRPGVRGWGQPHQGGCRQAHLRDTLPAQMRLATFLPSGADAPLAGEVAGEHVTAFGDGSTVLERLRSGDRTPARGEAWPLSDVRLLAPVPRPRAIFCIGRNYAAHAGELGNEVPEAPIVFLKLPTSSTAPNDPVEVPAAASRRLDYEGELVVVIGAGGEVAGFAVADDLSARDLQGREPQWTRAKG